MWILAGRTALFTWSGVRKPRSVFTGSICTPPITAAPPTSELKMCESRSRTTSWPECVCASTDRRLPIVPELTNSALSVPTRAAAIASRRLTVGSSSHTSSPTSARAMASRISGVGWVMVSERRSTKSCTGLTSSGGAKTRGGPASPLGVRVIGGKLAEQIVAFLGLALGEVDVGQRVERLGNHQRARILLQHELQPLTGRARVALVEVVGGDPHFLLGQLAAADVDLGERVGGVAALGIFLDELLELFERLGGESLVLLDRLELIVVAHGQAVLHEVGDLMAGVEGEEDFELLDRLVELRFSIERLADQEARERRVRRVGMTLDDLAEGFTRFQVLLLLEERLALAVELVGRQQRRRGGTENAAAGRRDERGDDECVCQSRRERPHENWPIHIA